MFISVAQHDAMDMVLKHEQKNGRKCPVWDQPAYHNSTMLMSKYNGLDVSDELHIQNILQKGKTQKN